MYQQITIETLNAQRLRPVLEDAIQAQLEDVESGIQKTRAKLQQFEKKFGMTTAEFLHRFHPGDLEETLDFIEWQGETKMLKFLEERRDTLKDTRIK
ncbi:MAG: hypothetical protein OHK0052_12330 [Anaerolineales bacterium]